MLAVTIANVLLLCETLGGNVSIYFPPEVFSPPKAISSRDCPLLMYVPPRSIKLGQGRYALIGHAGISTAIPPRILKRDTENRTCQS